MSSSSQPTMGAHAIRRRFIEFFSERGHAPVRSSPLVPENDPSLLFVNAGMVQFKDTFTGREQRPYSRAVTCQKVLRAGGKHNDLDNVGFTPRHHTFFEMLGNFSFGDYFKADAIAWGWEFLTKELGIPEQRLCVSIFSGEGENAPADEEAFELWQKYVPKDRIYRCGAKDNFWQMGNTGPCGPCSEIHLFRGDQAPGDAGKPGKGPAYEDDKYLELWNLVFMQYEKLESGELVALPKPSIDTGAGLERLASVVAGVANNFTTDLLKPLVDFAKELAGVSGPQGDREGAYQVIADHARATAFLIADGVFPEKGSRSYVLRRIMRRAIRYGTTVGLDRVFFPAVCLKVVEEFGATYPELVAAKATIEDVVTLEEENFRRTLTRGLKRLEVALEALDPASKVFPIEVAAELYDTYGFPIDLCGVIAREHRLELDEEAVEVEVHRRQAGAESFVGHDSAVQDQYFAVEAALSQPPRFVGYEHTQGDPRVIAMLVAGKVASSAQAGDEVEFVCNSTPFYAESGGQVADHGVATNAQAELSVYDVHKPTGKHHFHRAKLTKGSLRVGDSLHLQVDIKRRDAIRRNHSATHMLHHALREVLGAHVTQKGSLVTPERLRFDFSHSRPISAEERRAIEQRIGKMILANLPTSTDEMTLDEARGSGAIGLFGEKYASVVRVVTISGDSVELCGGTHVARSGDIGMFSIVSETGIAQGVRRMEAVTGEGAYAYHHELVEVLQNASSLLHAGQASELPEKIRKVQADLKERGQEVEKLKQKLATGGSGDSDKVEDVNGVALLVRRIVDADAKTLRAAADTLRDRLRSGVVVLGGDYEGKAMLLVAVTKDLSGRIHAGQLIGQLAVHVGGRGGGKPDLAQAGGTDVSGLDRALASASEVLAAQLA